MWVAFFLPGSLQQQSKDFRDRVTHVSQKFTDLDLEAAALGINVNKLW